MALVEELLERVVRVDALEDLGPRVVPVIAREHLGTVRSRARWC